ncbi:alpha/beta hydrolase [Thermocatellispora tengchongensis]|uniref:alpha/beta hydrolase n=1 Tax=Thermocatellispora tengchongensis TaxID=1073253 RepID=UPI00362A1D88
MVAQARELDPKARLAVIAWLGYDAPRTYSLAAVTEDLAVAGARELRRTVARVRAATGAEVTLLCHSYGSVVCAKALPGLAGVRDVAVFGSPGLRAASAAELGTRARVWAGRGGTDWIGNVPHVSIGPLGFGRDPMDRGFGARIFAAGGGGHSDYLRPGGESLRNLALIALGRASEVRRGG